MSDENVPTVTVETDGVSITISDEMSAEAAIPFIEGVLEYYLGMPQTDTEMRQKRKHKPVDVECGKCGYEWTYRGKTPNSSTCPECGRYTNIDAMTEDRVDA